MSVIIINIVGDPEEHEDDVLVFSSYLEEEETLLECTYEDRLELRLMPIYEQK